MAAAPVFNLAKYFAALEIIRGLSSRAWVHIFGAQATLNITMLGIIKLVWRWLWARPGDCVRLKIVFVQYEISTA